MSDQHSVSTRDGAQAARPRASVIGLGVMGERHLMTLRGLTRHVELLGGYDQDQERCQEVCARLGVTAFNSAFDATRSADVVYIATPPETHVTLALTSLERGCHLFIEKPFAESSVEGRLVLERAEALGVQVVVGYVERFNPVIRWIKSWLKRLLEDDSSAALHSISLERIGPRPPRVHNVGILSDLAVHDLDLISYLSESPLERVQSVAQQIAREHEELAHLIVRTTSGITASINTHWLSPITSRVIKIMTSHAYIVGDLVSGQLSLYPRHHDVEMFEPQLDEVERSISRSESQEPHKIRVAMGDALHAQSLRFFTHRLNKAHEASEPLGHPTLVSGAEALTILEWVERCRRSATSRDEER